MESFFVYNRRDAKGAEKTKKFLCAFCVCT